MDEAAGPWVDSHCHLFLIDEDPADVLDGAVAAGVRWVLCPGTDLATSLESRRIAGDHPDRVLWSAGLHPHEAERWEDEGARISALAPDAAAIGECGLDYYRDLAPRNVQRGVFRDHVNLARDHDKPIIVHTRDSFSDVYDILATASLGEKVVLHCWTGGPRWTKRFLEIGATFSFAGPITYTTGDTVRAAAALVPPDRVLVETDSPYLAPEPHRGEDNRPALVARNGDALATLWDTDVATVAEKTTDNAARVFGGPA